MTPIIGRNHQSRPKTRCKSKARTRRKVFRLMDALDELDDTQHVYSNFDISEEVMAKLEQEQE